MPSVDKISEAVEKLIDVRINVLEGLERNPIIISIKDREHRLEIFDLNDNMHKALGNMISGEWLNDEDRYDKARVELVAMRKSFEDKATVSDKATYVSSVAEIDRALERKFSPHGVKSKDDEAAKSEKDRRKLLFQASTYEKLLIRDVETEGGGPIFFDVVGKNSDDAPTSLIQFIKELEAQAFIDEVKNA